MISRLLYSKKKAEEIFPYFDCETSRIPFIDWDWPYMNSPMIFLFLSATGTVTFVFWLLF